LRAINQRPSPKGAVNATNECRALWLAKKANGVARRVRA
jgi:hypothetical protein